ncbi:MAG: ParA family protein [Planctomycetes bacterium]|nr:ParA family protein [Planctomycetota bacterium]
MLAHLPASFHSAFMIIAVVNQKGGVGKTTLAVHLAVWHLERGRRVAFIDADGQSSATRWLNAGGFPLTLVTEVRPDPIIELAGTLRTTHDLIIADGPASLAESTRALLLVADFAIVPCGVTVPELESTADTIRMITTARMVRAGHKPRASLVLTRIRNDRFLLTREAHEAARRLGIPVCRNVLRLREAVADAAGQRSVVWKMGGRARPAADEMLKLLEEIEEHAGQETNHDRNTDHRTTSISAQRSTTKVVCARIA